MTILQDPYVIKVGLGCNNNCKFCFQSERAPVLKDTASVQKELLVAKCRGYSYLVFEGGEPTLNHNLNGLVRFARRVGFKQIDIQSNGRMFAYMRVCQQLAREGVDIFSVSLHAHKEKIHDYLTSTPGSFKEVLQGIGNLRSLNQKVANQVAISKVNYRYLPEMIDFFVDCGICMLQLNFIQPIGIAAKNLKLLVPTESEVVPYVKKALRVAIARDLYVGTVAIPCCILGKYAGFAQEYKRARAGEDPDHVPFKRKRSECEPCIFFAYCEGPWSAYVKYFGWKEFVPVKRAPSLLKVHRTRKVIR